MRRWYWLATLGVVFVLVVAGCGSAPAGAPTVATGQAQANTASTTGSKDQIVLAIGGESEDGYDPTLGWGRYGSPLFQSTLLRRDENLKLVNDLATEYTVSADKLVWTVNIRDDVKFPMGSH